MIARIRDSARRRGITRLCHFTQSRSLLHILTDGLGIRSSRQLSDDPDSVLNATDADRLDGHTDHICCSIQYPNAWYLRKARGKERLFRDWVVVFIAPHYLWRVGTKFSPRNAAAGWGAYIKEGAEAFEALFAETVSGAGDRPYSRGSRHPSFLPTDEQAEVLVPGVIAPQDLEGIAVATESQARAEVARLEILGVALPQVVIAPSLFKAQHLSRSLRGGSIPEEWAFGSGGPDEHSR